MMTLADKNPLAVMLSNLSKMLLDPDDETPNAEIVCCAVAMLGYAVDELGDNFPYGGIFPNDGELWIEWFPEPYRTLTMMVSGKHNDSHIYYCDHQTDEYDTEDLTPNNLVKRLWWYLGKSGETKT